jgi:inward rectifier potassium channel
MSNQPFDPGKSDRDSAPGWITPLSPSSGPIRFRKINAGAHHRRELYHWLLTLSWPKFSAVIFTAYLAVNLLFALVYLAGGGITEMRPGSFSDAYFFSVETLSTVGYGHMYPDTLFGHSVATLEIMVGLFGVAAITGLIFVRFCRPTAAVAFSSPLVWRSYDGQPCLMFRVANVRQHSMAEAEFRLMLLRERTNQEGETYVRFYPLQLEYDRLIAFPAAVTIRHLITEDSPLHGLTREDLEKLGVRFLASVVCIDTVIPASVQSQKYYSWRDIQFGRRFVEIYTDEGEDLLTVDYGRFHETEEMPSVAHHGVDR